MSARSSFLNLCLHNKSRLPAANQMASVIFKLSDSSMSDEGQDVHWSAVTYFVDFRIPEVNVETK